MKKTLSLKKIKKIHFTGIKGVGMAALAYVAQDMGIKITGSDLEETFITDYFLKKRGLSWQTGFSPQDINHPDLLITTGSHGGLKNPQVIAAKKKNIPVMTHGEALGFFMKEKTGISICGVGGKTTTSAIIATILDYSGKKPSYAIGAAEIFPLGSPGQYQKQGKYFIAEADEYATSPGIDNRPRFYWQNPQFIINTNIKYDHPDIYSNIEQTKKTFLNFFEKIPPSGQVIINGDSRYAKEIIKKFKKPYATFGFNSSNDWQIVDVQEKKEKTKFSLLKQGKLFYSFSLSIPGRFNIMNATAAIILCQRLGLKKEVVKRGLASFRGTKRRFEFIGRAQRGFLVYDDYAHHPHEIKKTLEAAHSWFGKSKNLIVIFQSHTYSRTKKLLSSFAKSFSRAHTVIIPPIYGAREKESSSFTSLKLAQAIKKYHPRVIFVDKKEEAVDPIKKIAQKGNIVFTMGAGDIWKIGPLLLKIK